MIGEVIGTLVPPIENSPVLTFDHVHSSTPGVVVGQSLKFLKIPFGVADADEANASAETARAASARAIVLDLREA
jgi:hypothetical protein